MIEYLELKLLAPPDHPALPGHFPGHPLIPGVVVVDLLVDAIARHLRSAVALARLRQVKFAAALEPACEAIAAVELDGMALSFRIEQERRLIASGQLELRSRAQAA